MVGLSIQVLTWQRYMEYARSYMTFSQAEMVQMAFLSVFIFAMYFMYQAQLYGARVSLIRTPRKILIALWTTFIIGMTLINRGDGLSDSTIWNPWITLNDAYHGNVFEQFQTISNVLLFIPYGFLVPWNVWYCRRGTWCMLICGGTSLLIEMEQYITGRGVFDTSDLLLNLLGGMIGFLIYFVCERIRRRWTDGELE